MISGASRGIGLAAAKLLVARGDQVIGTASDGKRLEKAAQALGNGFIPVVADLRDPAAGEKLAAVVAARWGSLDSLVNNAGINLSGDGIVSEPAANLAITFQLNVFAPHGLVKALLPLLKKGVEPRILNVSSESGQRKRMTEKCGDPSYCLSKYALNGLTQLWASGLEGEVAVNAMHPGWIQSDMGGPDATDTLEAGGRRVLQALDKPFVETGKFWYGSEDFSW